MTLAHRIYVGTIGEGLWRSSDGGETYRRVCDGMFVECHVRALAVHPQNPNLLYMGTELGLFRSSNGADHWERVESPLNGQQIWSILLLPHDPSTILVGTCPGRLFRSGDGGRTWTEPAAEMERDCPRIMHTRVTTLVADPTEPETLWAGIEIDGLRRSRDAGKTWEKVGRGLSSLDIHGLAIIPLKDGQKRMLVTTNNDVNRSDDNGETWTPLGLKHSLPWSYFRGIAQQCGNPEVVLVGHGDAPPGSTGLVVRSKDAGKTWSATKMPGLANSTIWNFAVNPADANLIYASSVSGEVFRSVDGGLSWERTKREFGEIRALVWIPENV